MEIIIAAIIAVVGWIITHILAIKAQNRNFVNQIINDARLKVTSAIKDYQDWLGKIDTIILNFSFDIIAQERGSAVDWLRKVDDLRELFFSDERALKWIFCLEEHEILFPKTTECRNDLGEQHKQIGEYLLSFLTDLQSGVMSSSVLEHQKAVIEKAQQKATIIISQVHLMEDLRIYLQNLCLGPFTGNKVPERKPQTLSHLRLVEDKAGNLQIVTTDSTTEAD